MGAVCLYSSWCGSCFVLGLWGQVLSVPDSMCLSCAHSCGVCTHAYRNQGVISVGSLQELSTFRGEGFLLTLWFIKSARVADEWAPKYPCFCVPRIITRVTYYHHTQLLMCILGLYSFSASTSLAALSCQLSSAFPVFNPLFSEPLVESWAILMDNSNHFQLG